MNSCSTFSTISFGRPQNLEENGHGGVNFEEDVLLDGLENIIHLPPDKLVVSLSPYTSSG
jgi:hypothetical protein